MRKCETCDNLDSCVKKVAGILGRLDHIMTGQGGLVVKFKFTLSPEDLQLEFPEGCCMLSVPPPARPYVFCTQIAKVANQVCPEKYNALLEASFK